MLDIAAHGPAPPPGPDIAAHGPAPPPVLDIAAHGPAPPPVLDIAAHGPAPPPGADPPGAWDAIVLAGGRGSRLGGVDKADVVVGGRTLLDRTLDAVAGAEHVVVVGDVDAPGCTVVQEEPRFAGPAAAIGAGLPLITSPWVMLVACDHPFLSEAIAPLLGARSDATDGVVAVDAAGRRQHLTSIVATSALRASVSDQPTLIDCPVHALLGPLDLREITLPARATQDVDTWHDRSQAGSTEEDRKGCGQ